MIPVQTIINKSMAKQFKYLYFLLLFIPLFQGCSNDDSPEVPIVEETTLTPIQEYFIEIAFGNEFGPDYTNIRKWNTNVSIYLPEVQYDYLNDELDSIISELNTLQSGILISRVESLEESNYIVYFGDWNSYVNEWEPGAIDAVENNWGLFWIYWTDFVIYRGNMYVDVFRTQDIDCQKHLLREELTQSLGLMNDSYDYPASIFYQEWTCGTGYAEIDKELIKILYDPNISAGMSKDAVITYFQSLNPS